MKNILFILLFIPSVIFGQQENRKSFFVSTAHGTSSVYKEAFSHTTEKTYQMSIGYGYSVATGLSFKSKKGQGFSDVKLVYRSYSNGILAIQDVNGNSTKTSRERFNYLGLGYLYGRYIKTIKNYHTFVNLGLELSYILNRKTTLNFDDRTIKVTKKGTDISNNYGISAPATFTIGYGLELDKGLFRLGQLSRLSLNASIDQPLFPISSPTNQYLGANIRYQILF